MPNVAGLSITCAAWIGLQRPPWPWGKDNEHIGVLVQMEYYLGDGRGGGARRSANIGGAWPQPGRRPISGSQDRFGVSCWIELTEHCQTRKDIAWANWRGGSRSL